MGGNVDQLDQLKVSTSRVIARTLAMTRGSVVLLLLAVCSTHISAKYLIVETKDSDNSDMTKGSNDDYEELTHTLDDVSNHPLHALSTKEQGKLVDNINLKVDDKMADTDGRSYNGEANASADSPTAVDSSGEYFIIETDEPENNGGNDDYEGDESIDGKPLDAIVDQQKAEDIPIAENPHDNYIEEATPVQETVEDELKTMADEKPNDQSSGEYFIIETKDDISTDARKKRRKH